MLFRGGAYKAAVFAITTSMLKDELNFDAQAWSM
jgi:hypothetical protein